VIKVYSISFPKHTRDCYVKNGPFALSLNSLSNSRPKDPPVAANARRRGPWRTLVSQEERKSSGTRYGDRRKFEEIENVVLGDLPAKFSEMELHITKVSHNSMVLKNVKQKSTRRVPDVEFDSKEEPLQRLRHAFQPGNLPGAHFHRHGSPGKREGGDRKDDRR
jgi:hypothetical protein